MRKSRFTEGQIIGILRELDVGTTAAELKRTHGIHANTIRLWKDRYRGLDASDLVRDNRRVALSKRRRDEVCAILVHLPGRRRRQRRSRRREPGLIALCGNHVWSLVNRLSVETR